MLLPPLLCPFKDSVLDNVFPDNCCSVDLVVVSRMATRFQSAVPEQSLDTLEEEVLDYKLAPMSSIPTGTTTDILLAARWANACIEWCTTLSQPN